MTNIVHSKKYLTKDLASFTKAKEISGNNLKALRTLSFFLGECHVERRCYSVNDRYTRRKKKPECTQLEWNLPPSY